MSEDRLGEGCGECLGRGYVFIGDQVIECGCIEDPGAIEAGTWVKMTWWELIIGFFYLGYMALFDQDLDRQGMTRLDFFKHGIQDLISYEVYVYDD